MIEAILKETLTEQLGKRLEKACYVVGVSGGSDSVALLHAACQVLPKERLSILHFNHLTRGEASNADEAFVRDLANEYHLPFIVERRKDTRVSEGALREERLGFFKREAKKLGAYILLAHHLDDQLETFLFRLIRGTQLKGLMGMRITNGRIVRPFLSIPKADLLSYVKANALVFREDSSNSQSFYFRNRIRHTFTPKLLELAERYGGSNVFYKRFSHLTQESHQLLKRLDRGHDGIIKKTFVRTRFFDRLDLRSIGKKRRTSSDFTRRLLETIDTQRIDRTTVRSLQKLMEKNKGRVSILGGFSAEISCGFLYFQSQEQRHQWELGISFRETEGSVTSDLIDFEVSGLTAENAFRTFLPGDRFGKKKLKEEFLRRRVPRLERRIIPLMVSGISKNILWFPGHSQNKPYGVRVLFPFAALDL